MTLVFFFSSPLGYGPEMLGLSITSLITGDTVGCFSLRNLLLTLCVFMFFVAIDWMFWIFFDLEWCLLWFGLFSIFICGFCRVENDDDCMLWDWCSTEISKFYSLGL